MEDTHEFVQKLHDKQAKSKKIQQHQGKEHASHKLPSKQHSTNR